MNKGIIVSIQGYMPETTQELAKEATNAGAVAIRTDKYIDCPMPIIGLRKIKMNDYDIMKEPYITPTINDISIVKKWLHKNNFIAIDFRKINKNLNEINAYCLENKIDIIADIGDFDDYENIIKNGYTVAYVASTLSVLYNKRFYPDIELVKKLYDAGCRNIIAEGNYRICKDVEDVLDYGINNVCIGTAISNIYKLTKKYTLLVR